MNTIINLLDPAKDAGTPRIPPPDGPLADNKPDGLGNFLTGIYSSLYLEGAAEELGIEMKGVGDTKIQIERKVEEILGTYIHQSFTDLKFNASGDDKFRLGNINFVIDSGYKLKTIGDKTCKSIIGPFSIIDPASREINNDTRQINLHRENKTFDFTGGPACKLLNMHKYVRTIEYTYALGGNPYNFKITFTDGRPVKEFSYNTKRVSTDPSVDGSKNEKRNRYILEKFPIHGEGNHDFNLDIKFRVFWKEGGDTFQVVWPKEYYGTHGLKAENVAVATCDKVVLWRCMVNGVACLYRDGSRNKFYPILDGVERPAFMLRSDKIIKKMLLDNLNSHNKSVVRILKMCIAKTRKEDFCISQFYSVDFHDPSSFIKDPDFRVQAAQEVMRLQFVNMIAHIQPLIESIALILSPMVDGETSLVDFRNYVYNYTCHTPYTVNKTNIVTVNISFKHFFNRYPDEAEPIVWDLYSAISPLYGVKSPKGSELKGLFGKKRRIPFAQEEEEEEEGNMSEEEEEGEEEEEEEEEEEGEGPRKKRRKEGGGSKRKRSSEKSPQNSPSQGLIQQYEKNKDLPNFVLYFIITYCQELFYIACAYKLYTSEKSHFEKEYGFVFNTEKIRNLCSPFGKFNMDDTVEYTEESGSSRSENTNKTCISLCSYLKSIYKKKDSTFTLFDLCEKKVSDLLLIITHVGEAQTIEGLTPLTHYMATSYYQALYDEDVKLCILNERDTKSPFESVEQYRDIKVKVTVKGSQEESVPGKKSSLPELIKELEEAVSAKTATKSPSRSVTTKKQMIRTPNRGVTRRSRSGSTSGSTRRKSRSKSRSASTRRKSRSMSRSRSRSRSRSMSRSSSRSATSMNKIIRNMQKHYAANSRVGPP